MFWIHYKFFNSMIIKYFILKKKLKCFINNFDMFWPIAFLFIASYHIFGLVNEKINRNSRKKKKEQFPSYGLWIWAQSETIIKLWTKMEFLWAYNFFLFPTLVAPTQTSPILFLVLKFIYTFTYTGLLFFKFDILKKKEIRN